MGGFISAVGDQQQADAQRQLAGMYRQQGGISQAFDEVAAKDALARGRQQQSFQDLRAGQVLGAQTAAYGASGVDAGVGSAADAAGATAGMSEYDKNVIANNAAREAWGYRVRGARDMSQALIQSMGARNNADAAEGRAGADDVSGMTSLLTMGLGR